MKKKKNGRLKIIIILSILVIIILIISKVVTNIEIMQEEKNMQEWNEKEIESQINEYYEDKICPQNTMSLYRKYSGNNDKNYLYKKFKVLVEELPEYIIKTKDKTEKEIIEVYQQNKQNLYKNFGIESLEEFLNLVNYIENSNIDKNEFKYCQIDEDTFKEENEGKYLTFITTFYYENDKINLKIYFANSEKSNPKVKFVIDEYSKN